jgi:hypothetical protein
MIKKAWCLPYHCQGITTHPATNKKAYAEQSMSFHCYCRCDSFVVISDNTCNKSNALFTNI